MGRNRTRVVVGTTVLIGVVGLFVLSAVLATILLAGAAAIVLLPIHRAFLARGLSPYWSAAVTAVAGATIGTLALVPFVFVLVLQRTEILKAIRGLQGEITLVYVGEYPVVFDLSALREALLPGLVETARYVGSRLAIISAKVVVFAFVIFGLLYYQDRLRGFVHNLVPVPYHDLTDSVHARVREVLFAHFVLGFLGGAVTYVFGLAIFGFLGQPFPATLALLGALFWILPVVNVETFLFALAGYHVVVGRLSTALLIAVVGVAVLVVLPRIFLHGLRERLGRPEPLSMPAYFVGFVGGGLTLGPTGVVLGVIAVTVLLTVRKLLSEDRPVSTSVEP